MQPLNIVEKLTPNLLQSLKTRLQYVKCIDGVELPVTIIGQGQPVLLLHAFGMDARQFIPFILPLAKNFCFYLPHFRGFGLSANTPTTQFDFIEQYADDVEQLLTYICINHKTDAVDVAAISMGALVMWAYFNRQQSPSSSLDQMTKPIYKVRRYLNIDQSPIVHNQPDWQGGVFGTKQDDVFAQFKEVMAVALPYFNSQNAPQFTHLPYSVKRKITEMERAFSLMSVGRKHSQWLVNATSYKSARKLAFYQHSTWQQKLRGVQAYINLPYDYRSALPNLKTPVTMLIGGQSQLYDPKWQYKICDMLPNAQAVEISNSGHAIPMDAPLAFIQELKSFLHHYNYA